MFWIILLCGHSDACKASQIVFQKQSAVCKQNKAYSLFSAHNNQLQKSPIFIYQFFFAASQVHFEKKSKEYQSINLKYDSNTYKLVTINIETSPNLQSIIFSFGDCSIAKL